MLLLVLPVLAADPAPLAVDGLACAWAVRFDPPYPWAFQDPPTTLTEATALVVEAPAERLRLRDVGQRLLYVEGAPVEVLRVAGDHALVLVPQALGNDGARAWFGDEALPERVDAAARARVDAAARGLGPVAIPRWGRALQVAGREDLLAGLSDWETRCGD